MTRAQAWSEAHRRWGMGGSGPGSRAGFVVVRRKNVVDRFEVGHYKRGGRSPGGVALSFDWKVMGRGPSWEEAFARAGRAEGVGA